MLDVYYLPTPRPDTPILVFSYGSGFYMDARTLPDPASIISHNLGSFATRGFMTVVPDYHLVDSGVKFPGAGQDVRDAMQWVVDNLPFPDSVRLYYGEDDEAKERVPLALLESASAIPTPRLLLGIGERGIPCLHPAMEKFDAALKVSYDEFVARGHNHVSLVFTLGTVQGEEWVEDIVKWIHARREPH